MSETDTQWKPTARDEDPIDDVIPEIEDDDDDGSERIDVFIVEDEGDLVISIPGPHGSAVVIGMPLDEAWGLAHKIASVIMDDAPWWAVEKFGEQILTEARR